MRFEELKNEELKREYKISVPTEELNKNIESVLEEKRKTFKMPGFREGTVPLSIVKQKFGGEVQQDALNNVINKSLTQLFTDKNLKPALTPSINLESSLEGEELVFSAKFEVFPEIPGINWEDIELEHVKIKVTDQDLEKTHTDLLNNYKDYVAAPEGYQAQEGDQVIVDFLGTLNSIHFEGGKGEDVTLVLGANYFLPDFEKAIVDLKAGDNKKFPMKFPDSYQKKDLAGQEVEFEVTVKEVKTPQAASEINDEFAKKLGVESKNKLDEMLIGKLESEMKSLSRLRLKKLLFDRLDQDYSFAIPEGMVKMDLDSMQNEIQQRAKNENKEEDQIRAEYSKIAERRVRLGILLSEIAKANNIMVSEEDLKQAVYAEAAKRPGQEKQVAEFYSKPENLQYLKGPIIEEKTVDFILTKIQKDEKEVDSKEFFENYSKELQATA